MTRKEYETEIDELARTIVSEAREYSRDLSEVIHETVDGHEYVIYYAEARDVVSHPTNRDALFEDFGDEQSNADGMLDCRRAYCAMEKDVYASIDRQGLSVDDEPNAIEEEVQ